MRIAPAALVGRGNWLEIDNANAGAVATSCGETEERPSAIETVRSYGVADWPGATVAAISSGESTMTRLASTRLVELLSDTCDPGRNPDPRTRNMVSVAGTTIAGEMAVASNEAA